MRVTFSSSFQDGLLDLTAAENRLATAEQQAASGLRINAPSDDPAGTAAAINDDATVARMDAYTQAGDAGSSRLAATDSALSDIINQLTAAQTAAQGAEGTTQTATERSAASTSLLSIRATLMSDINTQFNGTYLFSGSKSTTAAYADVSGSATYQGNTSPTSIDVGLGRSVNITFDGSQIFQGTDSQNVLDTLTSLASAVSSGDDTAIAQGITALGNAFNRATTAQSQVGTNINVISAVQPQLQAAQEQASTSLANVQDVDVAAAATALSSANTAYQAALNAVQTINQHTLMDYLR